MQGEISFRSLVSSDYSSLIALWTRCDGVEVAEGDDETSFHAYLARNPGLSLCAESDGIIVGAALCGHDGRRGLIYHLAVAREYRGRGIGKGILERSLFGLTACGIARTLILVAKDNTEGRQFWANRGFEEISDALPLGKDLV